MKGRKAKLANHDCGGWERQNLRKSKDSFPLPLFIES